ncbi:MAG: ADP-ribosylglycohydrolase family protein [Rhodospirillales bacterium]
MTTSLSRLLLGILAAGALMAAERPRISAAEYQDKVYASWLGQCIGNIYGLPHENRYIDEPGPDSIRNHYADLNRLQKADGCFSDDDTDFEYMYLHGMEKFGPEPRYKDIASLWKHHVRTGVWIANRAALALMHYGYTPPVTGVRGINEHWFQIDPQLINEIWAVTAPGMVRYAAQKSLWAARITADEWGVEPTVHYGAMYAAAFFERDVNKLIDIGTRALPEGSRFARTVEDMKALYRKYPNDWRKARAEMAQKYYVQEPAETKTIWNANLNGAAGILALLYGQGDFQKTLDLACTIGFDADNQAATMAGLLAVVHGTKGLPRELLFPLSDRNWKEPFNDTYKNYTRYGLPDGRLTDMARRTAALGEKLILAHGGRKITENGVAYYVINPDAQFKPPFEVPVGPAPVIEAGKQVKHSFTTVGAEAPVKWTLASGKLPAGLTFKGGVLSGSTTTAGVFPITIEARSGRDSDRISFPLIVRTANLALTASEILAPPVPERAEGGNQRREPAPRPDPEVLRDGSVMGARAELRGTVRRGETGRPQFGYRWAEPQLIGVVSFCPGPAQDEGWYRTLAVEYEDESGAWRPVKDFRAYPALPTVGRNEYDKANGVEYMLTFAPVRTKAIRIGGEVVVGEGRARERSVSLTELRVYAPLPNAEQLK